MKLLVVVGTFDERIGKPSKIGTLLGSELSRSVEYNLIVNGGSLQRLDEVFNQITKFDTIVWMPNIDNSIDKYLSRIKELNQRCLLVSSKRSVEKKYTEWDVVGRLLKSKSNLGILITKDDYYRFKLLDPLGNLWADTPSIVELGSILRGRLNFLSAITRLPSINVGVVRPFDLPEDYLETVRYYGQEFHNYVNAANPNRFLGNTATRCMSGFPGIRGTKTYFISRRNVEKSSITSSDFVEVTNNEKRIEYYGDNKPSVDTPIQIRLFNFYRNVNYIIHGHVYVDRAPMTLRALPCGAIEEYGEIKSMKADNTTTNFVINLRGHGCLLLARDLNFLKGLMLKSRPFPEDPQNKLSSITTPYLMR